jgi:hypothetical protein
VNGSNPSSVVKEYSVDPAATRSGELLIYSGVDIGTNFGVKAVGFEGGVRSMPAVTLTRGSRHVVFTPDDQSVVLLQGGMEHKDVWQLDLRTGLRRQLTKLSPDFNVQDFDVSRDGNEIVLERVEQRSEIVLVERP